MRISKYVIAIFIACVVACLPLYSQDTVADNYKVPNTAKKIHWWQFSKKSDQTINSYKEQVSQLKKECKQKNERIEQQNDSIAYLLSEISSYRTKIGAKESDNKKRQEEANSILATAKMQEKEMDSIIFLSCKGCISNPFVKRQIERSLRYYDRIQDKNLKSENLRKLLLNYERDDREIRKILNDCISNFGRSVSIGFADDYIMQLQNSNYYLQRHKESKNEWSNFYLDRMINAITYQLSLIKDSKISQSRIKEQLKKISNDDF